MNYLEKTTLLALVDEYGELWELGEEDLIYEKLQLSIGAYETAAKSFMMNPSAYYYNILISNMITLQYWTQRKQFNASNNFTVEAEF